MHPSLKRPQRKLDHYVTGNHCTFVKDVLLVQNFQLVILILVYNGHSHQDPGLDLCKWMG